MSVVKISAVFISSFVGHVADSRFVHTSENPDKCPELIPTMINERGDRSGTGAVIDYHTVYTFTLQRYPVFIGDNALFPCSFVWKL